MVQLQDILTALAGPVKVSVVGVLQSFFGIMICTCSTPLGAIVSLDGLKTIFATPVFDDFQLKLELFEPLLIDAEQSQLPKSGLYWQSLLA